MKNDVKKRHAASDGAPDPCAETQARVAKLLCRCLVKEGDRPTSTQCKKELVKIWDVVIASPWSKYEKQLHPRRASPCSAWSNHQRKLISRRFHQHIMNFMLTRQRVANAMTTYG